MSQKKYLLCDIPNKCCAIPKKQNIDCDIVRKNKSAITVDTVTDLSDDEDAEQEAQHHEEQPAPEDRAAANGVYRVHLAAALGTIGR